MCVIGVTGSLGTGKSTVAAYFKEFGATVIDADKIAHKLLGKTSTCRSAIVKTLGKEVIVRGSLSRKKIADLVFNDSKKLKALEKIIHPVVMKETKKKIRLIRQRSKTKKIVLDVPLLFESGMNKLCDVTITVKSNQKLQIQRAMKRLGIDATEARRRIKSQWSITRKARLSTYTINNAGDRRALKKEVKALWLKI